MFKKLPRFLLILLLTAASFSICLLFGRILFLYTVPMQDASYDLSLGWEGEAMPPDWSYDPKGWTVFIQEKDNFTPLIPDGFGGFSGLQYPGQTFYFSRVLNESLDSPTLRIGTANHNIAVFLGDELLYTDCPEQDNRIGYLQLPMLEWDRTEPIVLSLPLDYEGKILTIAQSTGFDEKLGPEISPTIYLSPVSLYCGYSYESSLIANSFSTAIPAALCFGMGVFLLICFLWQLIFNRLDLPLSFLAVGAFLWSTYYIFSSGFTYTYFGVLPIDPVSVSRLFAMTMLLAFLSSRLSGIRRILAAFCTILQGISVFLTTFPAMGISMEIGAFFTPEYLGLLSLLFVLLCGAVEWKRDNRFFRLFFPLTAAGLFLLTLYLFSPSQRTLTQQQLSLGAHGYFLWKLNKIILPAALFTAIAEAVSKESDRLTERRLLDQQFALAKSGFENLRLHHEEVMILRHDMNKHLTFLRQNTSDEAMIRYLDELLGASQNVRPIIQSRNKTLDIILNARLSEAAQKGISVEIQRSDVPETLPLSDTELCALMMNILDNAIHAALHTTAPYLHLDLSQKDGFFIFVCENAADMPQNKKKQHLPSFTEQISAKKEETVPRHGLGLKIIEQIIKRHGDLLEIKQLPNAYRITIAILLDQSLK